MKKVFFIDDESDSEKFLSRYELMQEEGIDIIYTNKLKEAFSILEDKKDTIGLIILDIIMPTEDRYSEDDTNGGTTTGLKLLHEIRNNGINIPVIILSIKRKNSLTIDMNKLNVIKYIEKPIETSFLVNVIKEHYNDDNN